MKTSDILREAAKATINAPSYGKTTRKRLAREFDARYGLTATWNARSALWAFFDWQNGEIPEGAEEHALALLLVAAAME